MAKVRIKAGKEGVERAESFGDFEDIRPGTYRMKLVEINARHAKGDDGKPDKSRPMLEFVVKPYSEDREGKVKFTKNYGQLWSYVRLTGEGQDATRAMWAIALGATPNAKGEVDLSVETDPDKPGTDVGKHVIVRVKGEEYQGEMRPKVATVWPVQAGTENVGEDDGDELEDGDDIDEELEDELEDEDVEDPFGEDEDEEPEEDDYLTEDGLKAMELKDLGKLATDDFDLDPKASIVKFTRGANKGKMNQPKTKEKLIAAILEAQGADSDDDEEVEEPF